jgi:hypothetical protein
MRVNFLPDAATLARFERALPLHHWMAWRIAAHNGLRISDVLALKTAQLRAGTALIKQKKTGKLRKIDFPADIPRPATHVPDEDYIFPSPRRRGQHLTRQAVWYAVKQAADRAGIVGNYGPHSARKTYAREIFERGGLKAAQAALQHDNTTATLYYVLDVDNLAPSGASAATAAPTGGAGTETRDGGANRPPEGGRTPTEAQRARRGEHRRGGGPTGAEPRAGARGIKTPPEGGTKNPGFDRKPRARAREDRNIYNTKLLDNSLIIPSVTAGLRWLFAPLALLLSGKADFKTLREFGYGQASRPGV